ncbi:thiolase C-terminal domain-containing protein [Sulfitobacter sp. MOLA879]|uniref:thiolase C-terminal domain-containing protein n=1 Tax=Sulfitobacter sp. MOLA879 TaxID=3368579 RepID=UPI003745FC33
MIAGVGMTPFSRPATGARYEDMAFVAITDALADAELSFTDVGQIYAGWVYGDSTSGQRAIYPLGMTGVPIVNVNNNCASGSSALFLARQAVASGAVDCALAVGFEQMSPGALELVFRDRTSPLDKHLDVVSRVLGHDEGPMTPRLFAAAGKELAKQTGITADDFAKIAVKARRHAEHNDRAVLRTPLTVEEVAQTKPIVEFLTKAHCCPPTSGAAAAIICSPNFAKAHGLGGRVRILAQSMTTDTPDSFDTAQGVVGVGITRSAAQAVYEAACLGPEDVDAVELHDCFTVNEALSYIGLGLTEPENLVRFISDARNSYGGDVVVNPSGGLLAKGHPLGATGLAQIFELVTQLRGASGSRQVEGARTALQHNIGVGGAAVVTILQAA